MKTQSTKILILGGGFAGVLAALRLAGKTKRLPVSITLVSNSDQLVERTRLHQFATGQALRTRRITHLLRGTGVQFVQATVTALYPDRHSVTIENAAGENGTEKSELSYDKLIYALGSFVDRLSVSGAAENAFTLDFASAQQLALRLPQIAQQSGRVAVIGAGLSGLEIVTELAERYPTLQVSLICNDVLGADLSTKATDYVRSVLRKLSITLLEKTNVARIESANLCLADGTTLPVDLSIYCGGFAVSPLARNADIPVNSRGQMLLDGTLRCLSSPDIYGAGDASSLAEDHIGLRMACATAMPMAAHAADALVQELKGQPAQPFRFGFAGRCVSLGRKEGFLQLVDAHDQPQSTVLTGRLGAWAKEAIMQYVIRSIQLTRLWPDAYQWSKAVAAEDNAVVMQAQFVSRN